jgi:hypothetical protein
LKVIQVPSPITGIASPVDGMARVTIGPGCAAASVGLGMAAATNEASAARRLNGDKGCIRSSPRHDV